MSLARHAKKRDANERAIIAALHRANARVFQLDKPADLLVGRHGRWYLLEVKDEAKPPSARKLTAAEATFFAECRHYCLPYSIVLNPEQALQAIGAIP